MDVRKDGLGSTVKVGWGGRDREGKEFEKKEGVSQSLCTDLCNFCLKMIF